MTKLFGFRPVVSLVLLVAVLVLTATTAEAGFRQRRAARGCHGCSGGCAAPTAFGFTPQRLAYPQQMPGCQGGKCAVSGPAFVPAGTLTIPQGCKDGKCPLQQAPRR